MKKTDNEIKFIKSAKRKFAEFISKNSVYGIFAVVLIAVCAITILALPHSKDNKPKPSDIIDANPTLNTTNGPTQKPTPTIPNKNTATPPSNSPTHDIIGEITPTPPAIDSPTPDQSIDVNADPTSKFKITLPFNKNTIITSYSNDTPIYSETLHEWACHVGLEFFM